MPKTMHKESPYNNVLTHSYSKETRPMTAARTRRKHSLVTTQNFITSSRPQKDKRRLYHESNRRLAYPSSLRCDQSSHEGQTLHDNAVCNPNIVTDYGEGQSRIGFNVSSSIRGKHRCRRM